MAQGTLAAPRTVRVSSKRQITIPASAYQKYGFTRYAYLEEREDGLLIRPVEVLDEKQAVDILRYLVEEGYEGEELVARFEAMQPDVMEVARKIEEAEEDVRAGRVMTREAMERRVSDYLDEMDTRQGVCPGAD